MPANRTPAPDPPPPGRRARPRRAARPAATDGAAPPRDPFYAGALDPAGRDALSAAAAVTGLDQEIALLRLRLRSLLLDHPDDHDLAVRAIGLLVRAVAAAARLTPAETEGTLEAIRAELDGVVALLAGAQADGAG